MSDKKEYFTLTGKAVYAQVHKVNKFGKYTLNLTDLTPDSLAKVKEYNIPIHTTSNSEALNGVPHIKLEQSDKYPPKVVDSRNNPMIDNIGNGSKVNVRTSHYQTTQAGTKKVYNKLNLNTVQVVDLVEYKSNNEMPVVEHGYVSAKALDDLYGGIHPDDTSDSGNPPWAQNSGDATF